MSLLPCTNCKLDGRECMLFKGKRESRGRVTMALKIIEQTLHANPGPSPLARSLRAQIRGFSMMLSGRPGPGAVPKQTKSPAQEQTAPQAIEASLKDHCWSLPPFIRPPSTHLDECDYRYLLEKHALLLPNEPLQQALVKSYLESVHTVLPVIDMHEFLLSMLLEKSGRISLFVYQALMYAGIGAVPFEMLANEGFSSRAEARDKFHCKVEVISPSAVSISESLELTFQALDRVCYETDPVDQIQGQLLMAYWQGVLRPRLHRSCWIQRAWSILQSLEPSWTSSVYRRTYWGCVLIDRLFALATQSRPYFTGSLASDMEALKLDDFYVAPYSQDAADVLKMRRKGFGVDQQLQRVKMFILNVSLCKVLDEAIFDSHTHGATSARELSPEQLAAQLADGRQCVSRLLRWYDMFTEGVNPWGPKRPTDIAQSFPSIVFDAGLSLLLSREIAHCCSALDDTTELGDLQRKRFIATAGVTSAFVDLKLNGLLEHVPPVLVALLLSAGVTHWTQKKDSSHPYLRGKSASSFSQCIVILEALGSLYPGIQQWVNRVNSLASTEDDILSSLYPLYPPQEGMSFYTKLLADADEMLDEDCDNGLAVPSNFAAWFAGYESSGVASSLDSIDPSVRQFDSAGRQCESDIVTGWELEDPSQKKMDSTCPEDMATFMVNIAQFLDLTGGAIEPCIDPTSICNEL
ncbi:hypothetical protein BDV18DRAFT_160112 [Aspergillus unguis]